MGSICAADQAATDKKTDKSAKSSSKLTPPLPLQQLKRICVQYVHAAVLGDTIVPPVYVEDVAASVRLVRGVNAGAASNNTDAASTATPDTETTFAIVKFLDA